MWRAVLWVVVAAVITAPLQAVAAREADNDKDDDCQQDDCTKQDELHAAVLPPHLAAQLAALLLELLSLHITK